jgi:hypothetical protein
MGWKPPLWASVIPHNPFGTTDHLCSGPSKMTGVCFRAHPLVSFTTRHSRQLGLKDLICNSTVFVRWPKFPAAGPSHDTKQPCFERFLVPRAEPGCPRVTEWAHFG